LPIANCQLPIPDCRFPIAIANLDPTKLFAKDNRQEGIRHLAKTNRQLAIANRQYSGFD
jgi:hypothetical protein